MNKVTVEAPVKRHFTAVEAAAFLGAWYRVADKDGSTIAYAPDRATAEQIAELFNEEAADD